MAAGCHWSWLTRPHRKNWHWSRGGPDWALRDGLNVNYLTWGPKEAKLRKQLAAGCNTVLIKNALG